MLHEHPSPSAAPTLVARVPELRALAFEVEDVIADTTLFAGGIPGLVVCGSMAMKLHGLDVQPRDVDLFVQPWLYLRLQWRPGWIEDAGEDGRMGLTWAPTSTLPATASDRWPWLRQPDRFDYVFRGAALIDGWPTQSLESLLAWKRGLLARAGELDGRRDRQHAEMIEAALG